MTAVRPAVPAHARNIDGFVRERPAGAPFHRRAGCGAVTEPFGGYTDPTTVAPDGDKGVGLLPLVEVRTR